MRGQIIKILPVKYSHNGDTTFTRVNFIMDDGSFASTDLCQNYRNYARWQPYLRVGTELMGLNLKCKGKVDADSWPVEIERIDFKIMEIWQTEITPKIYQAKML